MGRKRSPSDQNDMKGRVLNKLIVMLPYFWRFKALAEVNFMQMFLFSLLLSTAFSAETDLDAESKMNAAAEEVLERSLSRQASGYRLQSLEVRELGMLESIQSVLSLGIGFKLGESSKDNVHYRIVESKVKKNGTTKQINCLMRFEFTAALAAKVHVQKCENSGTHLLTEYTREINVLNDAANNRRSFTIALTQQAQWGSQAQVNGQSGVKSYSARILSSPQSSGAQGQ